MRYLLFLILLCGCAREPIRTEKTNNDKFEVSFLFEYEGIRVYRFYDDGRYHWFTNKGEVINTKKEVKPLGKTLYLKKVDELM